MLVSIIVPVAMIKSSSVEIVIGETCIAPAVVLSKPAGRHCNGPVLGTVQRAVAGTVMRIDNVDSVRVKEKK